MWITNPTTGWFDSGIATLQGELAAKILVWYCLLGLVTSLDDQHMHPVKTGVYCGYRQGNRYIGIFSRYLSFFTCTFHFISHVGDSSTVMWSRGVLYTANQRRFWCAFQWNIFKMILSVFMVHGSLCFVASLRRSSALTPPLKTHIFTTENTTIYSIWLQYGVSEGWG